jgi:hypothetical protein
MTAIALLISQNLIVDIHLSKNGHSSALKNDVNIHRTSLILITPPKTWQETWQ